eukprot:COSAG06_NODE_9292_length_1936_cov_16.360915_3_plen_71_part_00
MALGSVWCTPSLVVWDLVRSNRFENRHVASVSRLFHPKPTLDDPVSIKGHTGGIKKRVRAHGWIQADRIE